jgi:hypothetical protein
MLPNRKLPWSILSLDFLNFVRIKLSWAYEFVPIYSGHFFMFVHHPTPFDGNWFPFDTFGTKLCPPLHFQASFLALMLEAHTHFTNVTRIRTAETDLAALQVTELMKLYNRTPCGQTSQPLVSPPASALRILYSLNQQQNIFPTSSVFPTIPGSPSLSSAQQHTTSFAQHTASLAPDSQEPNVPGSTLSLSTSTNASSDASGFDQVDSAYENADPQLLDYAREPAMSWENLKNRPPLFPGVQVDSGRFETAEDVCRRCQ